MNYIDLRSDTVSWPTPAMRQAMAQARVGDDVYGDDPTVSDLEALAAEMVGKPAALFVPSGTFGNQLALFTWCPRGSEVILGEESHIIQHEAGAAAIIAGVQTRCLAAADGRLKVAAIAKRLRTVDIHHPFTSLICLENAHSSGRVVPLMAMAEVYQFAKSQGLPVHLDGARIFNAAVALGVKAAVIAREADSVMLCLSKGLCAPVGSILAGNHDFIAEARRKRKIMGGGLRQAGILAAAGIIALREMTSRLAEDHRQARRLADGLAEIPGLVVDTSRLDINMVFLRLSRSDTKTQTPSGGGSEPAVLDLVAGLKQRGILVNGPDHGEYRLVTHYWIDEKAVDTVVKAFKTLVNGQED